MANLFQAVQNVHKYGFANAIKGALQTPGGYLDNTPSNPNVATAIQQGVTPNSRDASHPYYNPDTHSYANYPGSQPAASPSPASGGSFGPPNPGPQPPPPTLTQDNTPAGGGGSRPSGGSSSVPVTFMGKQYSGMEDPHLQADKLAYFTKQHNDFASSLEKAYKSGLISFDERRKALDQNRQSILDQQAQWSKDYANNATSLSQSRDTGLGAVQASYAQASPDAVQSSQADYQNKITDQYNQGMGQLNDTNTANTKSMAQNLSNLGSAGDAANAGTAYGDLAQNKSNYDTQYANNRAQNDQALTGQQDQQANDMANYTAQQASAAGSAATAQSANIQQVDTNQLLSGLAATTHQMQSQGFTPEEIHTSLQSGLSSAKIDPKQADSVLNFFYGNFLPRYTAAQTTGQ